MKKISTKTKLSFAAFAGCLITAATAFNFENIKVFLAALAGTLISAAVLAAANKDK